MNAKILETVPKTTSPAKILPKSLKEREIIFTNSEISSSAPTNTRTKGLKNDITKLIGPVLSILNLGFPLIREIKNGKKGTKRERYSVGPSAIILMTCVAARDINARAKVVFKSLVAALINGIISVFP